MKGLSLVAADEGRRLVAEGYRHSPPRRTHIEGAGIDAEGDLGRVAGLLQCKANAQAQSLSMLQCAQYEIGEESAS